MVLNILCIPGQGTVLRILKINIVTAIEIQFLKPERLCHILKMIKK